MSLQQVPLLQSSTFLILPLPSLGFSQLLTTPVQSPGNLSPKGSQILYFASVAGAEAIMI